MRVLQTVVSSDGFRDPADNPRRLLLLDDLLAVCRQERADVLLIPGGFLTAANEVGVDPLVAEVGRHGARSGVAVVGGIDLPDGGAAKRSGRKGIGGLPYFGFGTDRDGSTLGRWRQVSADGADAAAMDDEVIPGPERVVRVNDRPVGVLICGELFNPRLRANLVAGEPGLILDLGHESMTRVVRTVRNLAAEAGCAVGHTHHLAGWYGRQLHWAGPDGEAESEYAEEERVVERDGLWAAWVTRQIG